MGACVVITALPVSKNVSTANILCAPVQSMIVKDLI